MADRAKLTPEAEDDLDEILVYTGLLWGEERLEAYFNKLDNALVIIGRMPQIGKPCMELPKHLRCFYVGSHMIIYRIVDDEAQVLRILNQRRDNTL